MILTLERVHRWIRTSRGIGLVVFCLELALCIPTAAQTPAPQCRATAPDERVRARGNLSPGDCHWDPTRPGQGDCHPAPGTRRNGVMARGTRLVWQGKIFNPAESSAVNRFFGLPIVRAQVYQEQSWLDGAPALILDYSHTSRIYAENRDEIRQIAPGLLLGLMYARTTPQPALRMFFVLEVLP